MKVIDSKLIESAKKNKDIHLATIKIVMSVIIGILILVSLIYAFPKAMAITFAGILALMILGCFYFVIYEHVKLRNRIISND